MLFMRLYNDKDHISEIDAVKTPGDLFYIALENDALTGYCQFRLGANNVYILSLRDQGDRLTGDGLLRSAMFYAFSSGINRAHFSEFIDMTKYAPYGYHLSCERYIESIDDFLGNCIEHKTKPESEKKDCS